MSAQPNPGLIFDAINAYQRSAAIKGAIELELFSQIGAGHDTVAALAKACGASERGIRILCDYLTVIGFLTKTGDSYALTLDTATFLDSHSPAYMGGAVNFLLGPMMNDSFKDVASLVRNGTTNLPPGGSVAPEHPAWVDFARAMAPMMHMPAQLMAGLVDLPPDRGLRVLDIAAGHGVFGIAFAEKFPNAQITALDWKDVLEVARENADRAGVAHRYKWLPGSAFDVEFGDGYDIVLLTNFLHHFDPATNEKLLQKVHASLAPGGRALTLEFVPNADRVSPPGPAAFSLIMLATTPMGSAYTFAELERMAANAGFARSELHALTPSMQQVVESIK